MRKLGSKSRVPCSRRASAGLVDGVVIAELLVVGRACMLRWKGGWIWT